MKIFSILILSILLSACHKDSNIAVAAQELKPIVITKVIEKPIATPMLGQLMVKEDLVIPKQQNTGSILDSGNKQARQHPQSERFFNSMIVYDYMEAALYQVYAAPLKMTNILLEPGEKIAGKVLIGDSATWHATVISIGTGPTARQALYLKPIMPNRKTTLSIPTNRRVYSIELTSFKESYMAQVSWNYQTPAIDFTTEPQTTTNTTELNIEPTQLNFNYSLKTKRGKPVWFPESVFDDGQKTYIKFPQQTNSNELPVLFLITKESKTQIVNYRYDNNLLIVDRLFQSAQLRLGQKNPKIVRIEKI